MDGMFGLIFGKIYLFKTLKHHEEKTFHAILLLFREKVPKTEFKKDFFVILQ